MRSQASAEDPAEERRRRLLESFEGALVTLLKALRGLRDTASRREKVPIIYRFSQPLKTFQRKDYVNRKHSTGRSHNLHLLR